MEALRSVGAQTSVVARNLPAAPAGAITAPARISLPPDASARARAEANSVSTLNGRLATTTRSTPAITARSVQPATPTPRPDAATLLRTGAPSVQELSIRALEQMRRTDPTSATARPSTSQRQLANTATLDETPPQNAEAPAPTRGAANALPSRVAGERPTRELPPPEQVAQEVPAAEDPAAQVQAATEAPNAPSTAPTPRQALQVVSQAVSALPADPQVQQAMQTLGRVVDEAEARRGTRSGAAEQPDAGDKPVGDAPSRQSNQSNQSGRQSDQQAASNNQSASADSVARNVLPAAPRFAMQRLLNNLQATTGYATPRPGTALDLQS